jgi:hypothetical protein
MTSETGPVTQAEVRLETFVGSEYWMEARAALQYLDNRVVVIGPGDESGLGHATRYATEVLRQNGFNPVLFDSSVSVAYELRRARQVLFVVCIVRTVGTASETLLLLNGINDASSAAPLPGVLVVVPRKHRDAHFARAVREKFKVSVYECDALDCANDGLGVVILRGLAPQILAAHDEEVNARAASASVPVQADDQGRRALLEQGASPPAREASPLRTGLVFALILLFAAAVALLASLSGNLGVALAFIAVVIVLFVVYDLRRSDHLSETTAATLLRALIDKIPHLRTPRRTDGGNDGANDNESESD